MTKKEPITRHGTTVAQIFVPTPHDETERELYELSKAGGIKDLLRLSKENNDMLKELLNRKGK